METPSDVAGPWIAGADELVELDYVNYRGEQAVRLVRPISIWFGKTDWHPGEQWILEAFDLDRQAQRSFALKDVSAWRPASVHVPG